MEKEDQPYDKNTLAIIASNLTIASFLRDLYKAQHGDEQPDVSSQQAALAEYIAILNDLEKNENQT